MLMSMTTVMTWTRKSAFSPKVTTCVSYHFPFLMHGTGFCCIQAYPKDCNYEDTQQQNLRKIFYIEVLNILFIKSVPQT